MAHHDRLDHDQPDAAAVHPGAAPDVVIEQYATATRTAAAAGVTSRSRVTTCRPWSRAS